MLMSGDDEGEKKQEVTTQVEAQAAQPSQKAAQIIVGNTILCRVDKLLARSYLSGRGVHSFHCEIYDTNRQKIP